MTSSACLPTELWIIILDLIMDSGIGLYEAFDAVTFQEVINQLRDPWRYSPLEIPSLLNLRLVCKGFNSLLPGSPYLVLKTHGTPIPNTVRAVYMYPWTDAKQHLQHILADPLASHRIVKLDLPGRESGGAWVPMLFQFLCENANSLPGIRSLTLGLPTYSSLVRSSPTPRFWGRLKDAFPHLVCLILRGVLKTTPGEKSGPLVVFQKLEILDVDLSYPEDSVYFPILRQIAFGIVSSFYSLRFTGRLLLESLLVRDSSLYGTEFEWGFVPRLRLLGVSNKAVKWLPPLPPQDPLQHLYVFIGNSDDPKWGPDRRKDELMWLGLILERLPTISRITLAYPGEASGSAVWGDFDEDGIVALGFTKEALRRGGKGKARIVLNRSFPGPPVDPHKKPSLASPAEMGMLKRGFWTIRKKFFSSTFRKADL